MRMGSGGVPLAATEIASIDDVVDRMRAIDATLQPGDGVACFNRLYLRVTEAVRAREANQAFESAGFLERLDVVFARLYFDAFDAASAGDRVPEAWEPLFAHRHRSTIAALQFALAGMNAHINHDLPLAVVTTCRERGITPDRDTPHGRDYHLVNAILRDVEHMVKRAYMTETLARLDEVCAPLDDALAMWSLYGARRIAWDQAELLWALERHEDLLTNYRHLLARAVGLAGNGFFV